MTAASRELAHRLAGLAADTTLTVLGRCNARTCTTRARLELPSHVDELTGPAWLRLLGPQCVTHHQALTYAALVVVDDPGRPCTSSCHHAASNLCRCSCAGVNHGVKP